MTNEVKNIITDLKELAVSTPAIKPILTRLRKVLKLIPKTVRTKMSDEERKERRRKSALRRYHHMSEEKKIEYAKKHHEQYVQRMQNETPEQREIRLAKNRERKRKYRLEHREEYNAKARQRNKKPSYKRKKAALTAKWRKEHPAEWFCISQKQVHSEHYREWCREYRKKRFSDPEKRMEKNRKERERRRRKRLEAKKLPLCQLDTEALEKFLKYGIQPNWKCRKDFGSQYSPDALIGKNPSFSTATDEDMRAAALENHRLMQNVENKEWRDNQ
jgi:hypothetical protein